MINKKILKNKITLLTVPVKEIESATLMILFKTGSRQENDENAGISHILEHMFFKGTKNRPNPSTIAKQADALGAEMNAFTGKEYTGYYIKLNSRHLNKGIDLLSDMILNPLFDKAELEKERGVILQELNMYRDNPSFYIHEMLEEIAFGHNLGRSIIGYEKSIKKIKTSDLRRYKKDNYIGKNTVISLAGKFETKHIKLIEKSFCLKPGDKKNNFSEKEAFAGKYKLNVQERETDQIHLNMALNGFSYNSKEFFAQHILAIILGGNMSSQLFEAVREKSGLAYSIYATDATFCDSGALVVGAGLDKANMSKAFSVIFKILKNIKKGVSKSELKRAKDYAIGKMILALEDSETLAAHYGKQILLRDKIISNEEVFKKINALQPEDIKRVANKIVKYNKLSVAAIGPFNKDGIEIKKMIEKNI